MISQCTLFCCLIIVTSQIMAVNCKVFLTEKSLNPIPAVEVQHADLCEDPDGEDHHTRGGAQ